jgi:hypothetical protein
MRAISLALLTALAWAALTLIGLAAIAPTAQPCPGKMPDRMPQGLPISWTR